MISPRWTGWVPIGQLRWPSVCAVIPWHLVTGECRLTGRVSCRLDGVLVSLGQVQRMRCSALRPGRSRRFRPRRSMAREGKPQEPLDESEVESMDALRRRDVEELSNGAARLLLFQRVRLPSTRDPESCDARAPLLHGRWTSPSGAQPSHVVRCLRPRGRWAHE